MLFIVTVRMGFQILFKYFRFIPVAIWYYGPAPLSTAIEGCGLGNRELEPSVFRTLYWFEITIRMQN